MGYGKRALKLLRDYYEGKITNFEEDLQSSENGN